MTTSQYHYNPVFNYMSENLRLDVDYMELWLHEIISALFLKLYDT